MKWWRRGKRGILVNRLWALCVGVGDDRQPWKFCRELFGFGWKC